MTPKSAKEVLEEIKAEEELKSRGYKKIKCSVCSGTGRAPHSECHFCNGTGCGGWQGPITK